MASVPPHLGPIEHDEFAVLYGEHAGAIYGHIRSLVPSAADADEVFQETNITLWKKFDQYQPNTGFRAWACRIAYYKILQLRSRKAKSPKQFSGEFIELVDEEMIVMSDTLDARTASLAICREKLSKKDRDLLARFYDRESSVKRIAAQVKRNTAYVYRSLRRIHSSLFDCINIEVGKREDL